MIFPKVTILLATFNRAHLIGETLDSIIAQTYSNWECIIVDDHSVDSTKEIIDQYIKRDNRFSYYLKTDQYKKGLSGTRNQGLDIAETKKAEFIQFFDDDDIMHPRKLELQIIPFSTNNKLEMTLCTYRKFKINEIIDYDLVASNDYSYRIESQKLFEDFLFYRISINSLGPIWKFSSIKKYRFDESLFYAEERDFYLRIFLTKKVNYKPINQVLFWYRKHDKSITSDLYENQNIKTESDLKVGKKIAIMILKQGKFSIPLLKYCLKILNR